MIRGQTERVTDLLQRGRLCGELETLFFKQFFLMTRFDTLCQALDSRCQSAGEFGSNIDEQLWIHSWSLSILLSI